MPGQWVPSRPRRPRPCTRGRRRRALTLPSCRPPRVPARRSRAALRSPWSTRTAGCGEGTARGLTVWHAMFKPELNREVFTILFFQATFWLFSVWTAKLKSKHEPIENSEVAFICVNLLIFILKGTYEKPPSVVIWLSQYIHFRQQNGKTSKKKR